MEELYGFYFTKDKIIEINYEYQFNQNQRTFFNNFDPIKYLYKFINIGKGYIDINKY